MTWKTDNDYAEQAILAEQKRKNQAAVDAEKQRLEVEAAKIRENTRVQLAPELTRLTKEFYDLRAILIQQVQRLNSLDEVNDFMMVELIKFKACLSLIENCYPPNFNDYTQHYDTVFNLAKEKKKYFLIKIFQIACEQWQQQIEAFDPSHQSAVAVSEELCNSRDKLQEMLREMKNNELDLTQSNAKIDLLNKQLQTVIKPLLLNRLFEFDQKIKDPNRNLEELVKTQLWEDILKLNKLVPQTEASWYQIILVSRITKQPINFADSTSFNTLDLALLEWTKNWRPIKRTGEDVVKFLKAFSGELDTLFKLELVTAADLFGFLVTIPFENTGSTIPMTILKNNMVLFIESKYTVWQMREICMKSYANEEAKEYLIDFILARILRNPAEKLSIRECLQNSKDLLSIATDEQSMKYLQQCLNSDPRFYRLHLQVSFGLFSPVKSVELKRAIQDKIIVIQRHLTERRNFFTAAEYLEILIQAMEGFTLSPSKELNLLLAQTNTIILKTLRGKAELAGNLRAQLPILTATQMQTEFVSMQSLLQELLAAFTAVPEESSHSYVQPAYSEEIKTDLNQSNPKNTFQNERLEKILDLVKANLLMLTLQFLATGCDINQDAICNSINAIQNAMSFSALNQQLQELTKLQIKGIDKFSFADTKQKYETFMGILKQYIAVFDQYAEPLGIAAAVLEYKTKDASPMEEIKQDTTYVAPKSAADAEKVQDPMPVLSKPDSEYSKELAAEPQKPSLAFERPPSPASAGELAARIGTFPAPSAPPLTDEEQRYLDSLPTVPTEAPVMPADRTIPSPFPERKMPAFGQ